MYRLGGCETDDSISGKVQIPRFAALARATGGDGERRERSLAARRGERRGARGIRGSHQDVRSFAYVRLARSYVLQRMAPQAAHARLLHPTSSGDAMHRLLTVLLIVLPIAPHALAPHALAAQPATQAWLLTPGARVRVTYPGQSARVGTLVSLAGDTLAVQWANSSDTA